MPGAFRPDIVILKTKSLDEGEVAPTLTQSAWMKLISDSVLQTIPTASADQAKAAAEAIMKRAMKNL